MLQSKNRVSLFFDNCSFGGLLSKPSIEELGNNLKSYLAALRYADGSAVPIVDVVAHSMGGLIVRSYLAGKQPDGTYNPPATLPIRKIVFLATPHFGTPITLGVSFDKQLEELATGSLFTFDLATWNQGTDDLRGLDVFAIAGNGGTGAAIIPRFDDGVVSLTSASIGFARLGRTRILPYCHTGPGLVTLTGLCPANAKAIAQVSSPADIPAIMVSSFLADTPEYDTYGQPAAENEYLFMGGGLTVREQSANGQFLPVSQGTANSTKLSIRAGAVATSEFLFPRNQSVTLTSGSASITQPVTVTPGYVTATILKDGPSILRVLPSAANVTPLAIGANSYISIYGSNLDRAVVSSGSQSLTVIATSPTQVNAVLAADSTRSIVPLTVTTSAGSSTVNVLIQPNVPTLFTQNSSGAGPASALNAVTNALVTASAPLRAGDYVSLYLTGVTFVPHFSTDVSVTIAGRNCPVQFAGVAPGYTVLDQINCQIPAGISSTSAPVIVTVNGRASNTATLAVQ